MVKTVFSKVTTGEGFGSFFVRQKSIIVIALNLNASLFFSERDSSHGYNFPRMLNYVSFGNLVPNQTTPSCVTSEDVLNEKFIASLCNNDPSAKKQLYERFDKCDTITHDKFETTEGCNDCIQPYVQKVVPKIFEQINYSSRKTQLLSHIQFNMAALGRISVGIHIRWGDTSTGDLTKLNSRSIGFQHVNEFYKSTLLKYKKEFDFYVFMEHHHMGVSEKLHIEDYSVIDTGDDLFDLYLFSIMDIVMHGPSTYAVLASLISPGKLIITNNPEHTRFLYKNKIINEVISYQHTSYNIKQFIDNKRNQRIRHFHL